MNPILLAVFLSPMSPLRAEYGAPRLRVAALEGEMRVRVADSLAYTMKGPVTGEELEFWPATVVEVISGRAVFESDLRAHVIAPAGAIFRVSMAEGRGLRVTSIPGTLPVSVRVGGFELAVWDGGSLAVHAGGRIEVENPGVYRVPGGLKGEGEELAAELVETGISLNPGDSLALDLSPPMLVASLPDDGLRDALAPASLPASQRSQTVGIAVLAVVVAGAAIAGRILL